MRTRRVEKIQARIDDLADQAGALLAREQEAAARIETLRQTVDTLRQTEPGRADRPHRIESHIRNRGRSRIQTRIHNRSLSRAEANLQRLQTERAKLVEKELREIMLALDKQSRRTRERLDEELERLAPVEQEWDRLRGAFDALEQAVSEPAINPLAGQWSGELEIPEFPVREREGYARPFPPRALLF